MYPCRNRLPAQNSTARMTPMTTTMSRTPNTADSLIREDGQMVEDRGCGETDQAVRTNQDARPGACRRLFPARLPLAKSIPLAYSRPSVQPNPTSYRGGNGGTSGAGPSGPRGAGPSCGPGHFQAPARQLTSSARPDALSGRIE